MTPATWYYIVNGQQQGPVPTEELKRLLITAKVQKTDLVWKEGFAEWVQATTVAELRPPMPPPPPKPKPAAAGPPPLPAPPPFRAPQAAQAAPHSPKPPRAPAPASQPAASQPATPRTAPPPLTAGPPSPAPQPSDGIKAGPFPGNGVAVQKLIDQIMEPGESFLYGITGDLAGGWKPRSFAAVLTSRRLLMLEKKLISFSKDSVKEWTAYPREAVRVSYKTHLLSASVTIHVQNGEEFTLDKIPKDAASRFEGVSLGESSGGFAGAFEDAVRQAVSSAFDKHGK